MKLKSLKSLDTLYICFIFIIAFFLTSDLFLRGGQSATFDGLTHITTLAQFNTGLSQGQFPVTWADGFANYGMPIPLIAQQTTNYLGGLFTFFTHDVIASYNLVTYAGAFLSCLFFYIFLRFYFKPEVAFLGTYLFNFTSYRIINIYIRGALPEFFAPVFIASSLISIYLISKNRLRLGLFLLIFSTAMIIFTHPFMFIVSLLLTIPYSFYTLYHQKNKLLLFTLTMISFGLGVGITTGYLIPLFAEVKYFYYGLSKSHFVPDQYLGLNNYFDPSWYYYYRNDIFVRGNFIQVGIFETLTVIFGCITCLVLLVKNKIQNNSLLVFTSVLSIIFIIMTTQFAAYLYEHISLLNGIQFPWRFLGAFIFLPPIILCYLVSKSKYQYFLILICVLLISYLRFPQLYGKNYTYHSQSSYFFTPENLHGNILNTVWTGKTSEYPVKNIKYGIIDGKGEIKVNAIKNGFRDYQINAQSLLHMIDYTFYFPGWRLYIDSVKTPIQYQNMNYRGIITYDIPPGNHHIVLKFEPTLDRIIGMALAIFSLILSGVLLTVVPFIQNKFIPHVRKGEK